MKELFVKYTVNIFTIATVIIVACIVLSNPFKCGKGTPTTANILTDSAIKANAEKDRKMAVLDARNATLVKDSIQQRINAEALAEETNNALTARADAEDNSKSWQHKYAIARKSLDTMLALASCDSLTLAMDKERSRAAAAQKACSAQVNQLGDVLANRNKQIAVLNEQVKVLKQPANIVSDALHAAKAASKEPWIKGYAGASAMGNQQSFGFGPDVSLQFRGGVGVRLGAFLMGNQIIAAVGVNKLISFKKK